MSKRPRRGTTASAVALVVVSLALPVAAAAAGDEGEDAPPSSTIAIPYRGEVELPAADGWTLLCDPPIALPDGVSVVCAPDKVTFSAPEYDSEWGTHEIVVRQVAGARVLDAGYRVTLAPPSPPVVLPTVWRSPADAGGTLLVPLSDLGLSCTACANAEVRIVAVEPADAARVGTNGSHIVVRPASGFRGMVVVTFGVADEFGQSTPVQLGVAVRAALPTAAGGLHIALDAPAGAPLELSADTLVWAADADDLTGARVISCGTALRGSVSCDGLAIRYLPGPAVETDPTAVVVDQFSVRVVTTDGRELAASVTVTLAPEIDTPSAAILVPAPLTTSAPLALSPTIPGEERDGGTGLLSPLSRILDGLTATIASGGSR